MLADRSDQGATEVLRTLLEHGAKFTPIANHTIRALRRDLIKCDPIVAREIIELLRKHEAMTAEQLTDLLRTPAIKRHLEGSGFRHTERYTSPEVRQQQHNYFKYRGRRG